MLAGILAGQSFLDAGNITITLTMSIQPKTRMNDEVMHL
jgi:hypothetical protein